MIVSPIYRLDARNGTTIELLREENDRLEVTAVIRAYTTLESAKQWPRGRSWMVDWYHQQYEWGVRVQSQTRVGNERGHGEMIVYVAWPVPEEAMLRHLDAINVCGLARFERVCGDVVDSVPIEFGEYTIHSQGRDFSAEIESWRRRN